MLGTSIAHFDPSDYTKAREAAQYLRERDWSAAAPGRVELGPDCFAQVLSYQTQDIEDFDFEVHHHRMDIHYVLAGEEVIEVSAERPPETRYLAERDLAYVERPRTFNRLVLHAGDFLVIGLGEPHRTNGTVGSTPDTVKKIVLKMTR